MQNAFIPANKLCRYGPIIAHSHADLNPDTTRASQSNFLFMLTSQVAHLGVAT